MLNIGNYKKDITKSDFDRWLALAIDIAAKQLKKEPHEVYQCIDLAEAKLFYVDHDAANDFAKYIVYESK